MKRQLVIGSLIGVALGGVLTASIAHGFFSGHKGAATVQQPLPPRTKKESVEQTFSNFAGQPPLRPGSLRIGPPVAPARAPEVPVALDAQLAVTTPTV